MAQEKTKNDLLIHQLEIMKVINEVEYEGYRLMARIALALYDQEKYENGQKNDWITFSTLKTIMNENDYDYSEGWNNRGIASSVSTAQTKYGQAREDAYHRAKIDEINRVKHEKEGLALEYIRHAIAVSFRNKDGKISYNPEKPDEKIQVKS